MVFFFIFPPRERFPLNGGSENLFSLDLQMKFYALEKALSIDRRPDPFCARIRLACLSEGSQFMKNSKTSGQRSINAQ